MEIKVTVNTGIINKSIYECSKEELRKVQDQLKQAWSISDQRAVAEFYPGMKVTFLHRGRTIEATVSKTNKTSVTVNSTIGDYKVSPTLLTKVENG